MSSAALRIARLRAEIERHDHLYYVAGEPKVSDRAYDALLRELSDLEAANPALADPDSPTQRVAHGLLPGFPSVKHTTPMLSLDNTYSLEELAEFPQKRVVGAIGDLRLAGNVVEMIVTLDLGA